MKHLLIIFTLISIFTLSSCEKEDLTPDLTNKKLMLVDGYYDVTFRYNDNSDYRIFHFYMFTDKYQTNLLPADGRIGGPIDIFTKNKTIWRITDRSIYLNGVRSGTINHTNSGHFTVNTNGTSRTYIVTQRDDLYYFKCPETRGSFRVSSMDNPIDSLVPECHIRNFIDKPYSQGQEEHYAIFSTPTIIFKQIN
jgi:hypothetical protein